MVEFSDLTSESSQETSSKWYSPICQRCVTHRTLNVEKSKTINLFTGKCPSKLPYTFRNFCYGVFGDKSWQSAQTHCQSLGANLAWIDDSSEQVFVERTLMTGRLVLKERSVPPFIRYIYII